MTSPDKACAREPAETFFTEDVEGRELPFPTPRAQELCSQCPFRPQCLQFAQEHMIEFGTWGGMSGYQRRQLNRKIDRKKCPGCSSTDVIHENSHDICLACGVSWDIF